MVARNSERGEGDPRRVREERESEWEKRSGGKRGRCGRRVRRRGPKGRRWWRRRRERPRAACGCRRGVRIPALEGRGEAWAGVREEDRRLRRGRACRGRRARSGRFSG